MSYGILGARCMKEIMRCENVWKIYGEGTPAEVQALRNVNLKIKEGDFASIMGSSGSGKSTLLNCIGLLDVPTRGKIFIGGRDVSKLDENERARIRRNEIGFVFQFFNLIPSMTALQNVELPMIFKGYSTEKRRARAKELLGKMGLADRLNSKSSKLSGGETQRVAIARALANDPLVIFADEPTGNLDSKTGKSIMQIFKKLNDDNKTIVLITHDINVAKETKKIFSMCDGEICEK